MLKKTFAYVSLCSVGLFFFVLSFDKGDIINFSLFLIFLTHLPFLNLKKKYTDFKMLDPSVKFFFCFLCILIIYNLIRLFFTDDIAYGLKIIEKFAVLLFIPFIVLGSPDVFYRKKTFLVVTFLLGNVLSATILHINSFNHYFDHGDFLFYNTFGIFIYSNSISLFYILSLLISLYFIGKYKQELLLKSASIFLSIFFIITIFILSSKAAILSLLVCLIVYLFNILSYRKILVLSLSICILIISMAIIYSAKPVKERFLPFVQEISLPIDSVRNDVVLGSTTMRKVIYYSSFKTILEKPFFGYGAGSAENAILNRYEKEEFKSLAQLKVSEGKPHNAVFSVLLMGGLVGLLFFLVLSYFAFHYVYQRKNIILIPFFVALFISIMFDNLLINMAPLNLLSFVFSVFFVLGFGNLRNKNKNIIFGKKKHDRKF